MTVKRRLKSPTAPVIKYRKDMSPEAQRRRKAAKLYRQRNKQKLKRKAAERKRKMTASEKKWASKRRAYLKSRNRVVRVVARKKK